MQDGANPMTALQTRLIWLEAISERLRRHIQSGGNGRSNESALLSLLLFRAVWDLSDVSNSLQPVPSMAQAQQSPQNSR
jgi:hypothetical protein